MATPAMAFGTALHRALELHHRGRWLGHAPGDLLQAFVGSLDTSETEVDTRERGRMIGQAEGLLAGMDPNDLTQVELNFLAPG